MAEGNFLGKKRKNFFLSSDCCRYIVELCFRLGLSEGAVIELAIRAAHKNQFGERPWTKDPSYISLKQQKRLWAIAKGAGWSNDQIRAWFDQAGIEGPEHIKWQEYEDIIAELEKGPKA